MTKNLVEPDADEQLRRVYSYGMQVVDIVPLAPDQKYLMCLLRVAKSVDPAEYPLLCTAIEALTGVRSCNIIADHVTRATVPANYALHAVIELTVRLERQEEELP